ncbi:MAG: hypothetical protein JNK73_02875 [Bacteroidia bacterium]|nr:hypothetical protein [Bacteroidia bacterium]
MKKLLLSHARPVQLVLALLGSALGLAILMAGVQMWVDVSQVLKQKDMLGGDYVVINKKVSLLNTLGGKPGSFSQEEQQEIRSVKGISDLAAFRKGRFKASMELSGSMGQIAGPGLKTLLFFEALPDRFIDVEQGDWHWKSGDRSVPIIIPTDYFNLYNQSMAESQQLPVIPENLLKSVTFKLTIEGNGKTEELQGRIAGFSQRINSILVPEKFLDYANQRYGPGDNEEPSRLILHAGEPSSPALSAFFRDRGYELNQEKLKASRINTLLQLVMAMVALLGVFIVGLALLGFLQYNQLLAYRSAWEIQTLHWTGFSLSAIARPYLIFILRNLLMAWAVATALAVVLRWYISNSLAEKGLEADMPGIWPALLLGIFVATAMATITLATVRRQIKQLAR